MTHTTTTADPLAPFRAAASTEQRAAVAACAACQQSIDTSGLHDGDEMVCGECGAELVYTDEEERAEAERRQVTEDAAALREEVDGMPSMLDRENRDSARSGAAKAFARGRALHQSTEMAALVVKLCDALDEAQAEAWRLREEASRPAPRSPEEEEAMAIIRRAAESLRAKEPTPDDLSAIEKQAGEDKAVASRATARPWKWWTANSRRELRSEAGRRSYPVAYGQQHPYDGVIDIAVQEPDMALIERAVNGLEERADALLRLAAEVRRLRALDAEWQRATRCAHPDDVADKTVRLCSCEGAELPQIGDEIDACWKCDGMVKAHDEDDAVNETDRAQAMASTELPRAGEESGDG